MTCDTIYFQNNISIGMKDKIITFIKVYIPLDWKPDIFAIYDTITGYTPYGVVSISHPYKILDKLETIFPSLKNINRGELLYDARVYLTSIDVRYDNNAVEIEVDYTKYRPRDSRSINLDVYIKRGTLFEHVCSDLFTDNTTDEELNNKGDNNMKLEINKITRPNINETGYIGDNIEISVKDKIINNIVAFIPSDLNIPHVFMIYKILTGTLPGEYAIADLYPYEMLYKLEACYPCVKKISRSDLYNKHICPSGIGIGCDKNGIKITVTYGEYDKRDRWQAMQAYSIGDKRIRDAVGKVYGYNWTNNLTKELREAFNEKGDYKKYEIQ